MQPMRILSALLATSSFFMCSCMSPRFPVRTLPQGVAVVTASLGALSGQTIDFTGHGGGQPNAYPVMSTGFGYGAWDGVTLHANLHPLPIFFGNLMGDVGVTARVCKEDGLVPELSFTAKTMYGVRLSTNNEFGAALLAFEPALTASYSTDTNNIFYVGYAHQMAKHSSNEPLYWRPLAFLGFGKKNYSGTRPLYQLDAGVLTRDEERKIVDGFIMMTLQIRL